MVKIDLKDKKILAELDMHARIPLTELARKVRLSRQAVEYRINRLRRENVIFGAVAVFDTVVVGLKYYRLTFRLLNITREQKNNLIEYLKQNKYILWLGETGGNWDIVVNFVCRDHFHFNTLFEEIIQTYGKFIRDCETFIYINVYDLEKTYILEKKGQRKEFFHEMKYDPNMRLDALDKNIIRELSKDAWITNVTLANKYSVSANTIKNRIEGMIKNKLLLGFRTFVSPFYYGYKSHILFLEVNHIDLEREKKLYSFLKSIPNITFLVKHIGKWRVGMEIETKDVEEFQELFVEIRGKFSDLITNFEYFPLFRDHVLNYFPEGALERL